jgi:SEC-C motif domain protein
MAGAENIQCPCGSNKTYKECCGLYHLGKAPPDAVSLMKSRYSAYALGNALYIIATTHPDNPRYERDKDAWIKGILEFSRSTQFQKLEILEVLPKRADDGIAIVTFKATLMQGGRDTSFTERSYFKEVDGKWRYLNGDILESKR